MDVDYSKMEGWSGDDLPDAAVALIVVRKFYSATSAMAAHAVRLQKEIEQLISNCPPQEVTERLQSHSFFCVVMNRLAEQLESVDNNQLYRRTAQALYEEVRNTNADSIIALALAMWVTDGATFPDGLVSLVERVEEADELGLDIDLTGEEE